MRPYSSSPPASFSQTQILTFHLTPNYCRENSHKVTEGTLESQPLAPTVGSLGPILFQHGLLWTPNIFLRGQEISHPAIEAEFCNQRAKPFTLQGSSDWRWKNPWERVPSTSDLFPESRDRWRKQGLSSWPRKEVRKRERREDTCWPRDRGYLLNTWVLTKCFPWCLWKIDLPKFAPHRISLI